MQEVKILREITIPSALIQQRDDDIIRFEIHEEKVISVQDIKDMTEIVGIWGQGKKFYNLIVMPDMENIPFDVRQYTAGEERSRFSLADAFVIPSIAMQVIGNFYLRFHKPFLPTKLFSSERTAIEWLDLQKKLNA